MKLTFIIIFAVVAYLFLERGAVRSVPAIEALALPAGVVGDAAIAVSGAAARAALQRAVPAVPARHAEAGTVFALAVVAAAGVAEPQRAELAAPARRAHARLARAPPVRAALQVAHLCNTAIINTCLDDID